MLSQQGLSRSARSGWIAITGVLGALVVAPALAQPDFWQPASGPGGGAVAHLVRQPDGDLYAAMGESPTYRSSDGGGTWQPLPKSATRLAALANGDLYALGSSGLDRSRDEGATWVHLNTAPANGYALVAMPGGTLLVGTTAGVWRSLNDGAAWESTALGSSATLAMVVEGGVVYAGAGSKLMRSDNEGTSWTPLTDLGDQTISALARRPGGGWWIGTMRANYYGGAGRLYRLPEGQPPEIMRYDDNVTAILVRPPVTVFVASLGDGFYESWGTVTSTSNDGATWNAGLNGSFTALVLESADGVYAASTLGPGHLGSYPGMGIWRTSGPGTNWSPCNNGLVHATSFALAAAAGTVYAQAGFSLAQSSDHGTSWQASAGRFPLDTYGLQIAAHPSGDVFAASVPWVLATTKAGGASTTAYQVGRSRDGGKTWTFLQVPGGDWNATLRVTAAGSVLTPSSPGVVRSTNRGDTWEVETAGLPYQCTALQPGPISRVFASAWGFTYVSENDGITWRQMASLGGSELAVSPLENLVYARNFSGAIFRLEETTGGGDWSAQELPPLQSYGPMAVDESGTLYVASDTVWRKGLADAEWQAIPGTPTLGGPGMGGKQSILFDDAGFLYVGTGMHGVLRSRLPVGRADPTDVAGAFTSLIFQSGQTPFMQSTAFTLQLARPEQVSLSLFDVRGRLVLQLWDSTQLGAGHHVASWQPAPSVASGAYYYRLVVGSSARTGRVTLLR